MTAEAPHVVETVAPGQRSSEFDQEFVQMAADVAAGWVRELEGDKVEEVADRIKKLVTTILMSPPLDVEMEILNLTCVQCRDQYYTCRQTNTLEVCMTQYNNCMATCT